MKRSNVNQYSKAIALVIIAFGGLGFSTAEACSGTQLETTSTQCSTYNSNSYNQLNCKMYLYNPATKKGIQCGLSGTPYKENGAVLCQNNNSC